MLDKSESDNYTNLSNRNLSEKVSMMPVIKQPKPEKYMSIKMTDLAHMTKINDHCGAIAAGAEYLMEKFDAENDGWLKTIQHRVQGLAAEANWRHGMNGLDGDQVAHRNKLYRNLMDAAKGYFYYDSDMYDKFRHCF